MKKNEFKHILIILAILSTLFLAVSFVSAEDNTTSTGNTNNTTPIIKDNYSINNENKTPKVAKPTKLTKASIISSAKVVKTFTEKNKKLPNYVTVAGYKFSMPEFLYLMSKTIYNKKNKINSNVIPKYDIKNPSKPSGTWVRGKIYSVYYSNYANSVIKYADARKHVPNYITTAGGNRLQYQSLAYLFAKALSGTTSSLPYYVTIDLRSANPINKYLPNYSRTAITTMLGKGDLGYAQLIGVFGDANSNIKVAYIIGQHPLEANSHNSLYKLLSTKRDLKYQYYVYKITVTKDAKDYTKGRLNGQLIAQKYVLPHIKANKYNLVIDIHSNQGTEGGNYLETNFIFAPLNHGPSKIVANNIISQISGLVYYFPASQTSPPYCTEPLIKAGVKTLVYETYLYENSGITDSLMRQLINIVDKLAI